MRLDWAYEELQAAHQVCLEMDKEFAHEVCQFVFAVGCLRESWKLRLEKSQSLVTSAATSKEGP